MTTEAAFLFSGVVFGLSGGLSPGPLLTLMVSETLRHGIREGIKIAIAPLLTDLPIILITLFLLSRLADIKPVLASISLLGGGYLAYLGYESIRYKGAQSMAVPVRPDSLRKGVIANFLNPNPYLFWFSIGAPTVLEAYNINWISVVFFVLSFYVLLVGSKVVLAVLVGKSRPFLKSKNYIYTLRLLGIVLWIFAFLFIKEGFKSLGIL